MGYVEKRVKTAYSAFRTIRRFRACGGGNMPRGVFGACARCAGLWRVFGGGVIIGHAAGA